MSGFNISNRQIALFLMVVATLWALAEGAPLWLVAVIALPALLCGAFVWWTDREPPNAPDDGEE